MNSTPSKLRGDRYAIIRLLGEGGQAATFEAVDKKEGKPVAVKRFRVRGAKSWKEVELAEREARVLASLSHPGLPRYIDHFEENGELYLVTEKIDGESLAAIQHRGATLAEDDVVRFLRDASAILDYLHGRAPPVVHRDVKPSNVLRRPDGSFVLIDFGAVRDKMKPEGGSTVVGTFGFMAPEQFQGRAMPASDVYAVGATALSMLTGLQPEDLPHKGLAIDVVAALGKNANPSLVSALGAMLEPDPDRRASRIAPLIESWRKAPPKGEARRDEPKRSNDEFSNVVHDVERDIERGIEEAVQQMEQGFAEIKKEWSKSKKHESKAEHIARKAEKKAEQRARKAERRARKLEPIAAADPPRDIPLPVAGLLLLGLTIGQVAVLVALRAVVPTILTLLSVVFGKGLRVAATRVDEAGVIAHESMQRAKGIVRNRTERTGGGARIDVRSVETPNDPKRVRIAESDPTGDAALEREQEAEEEADAHARERRRK